MKTQLNRYKMSVMENEEVQAICNTTLYQCTICIQSSVCVYLLIDTLIDHCILDRLVSKSLQR